MLTKPATTSLCSRRILTFTTRRSASAAGLTANISLRETVRPTDSTTPVRWSCCRAFWSIGSRAFVAILRRLARPNAMHVRLVHFGDGVHLPGVPQTKDRLPGGQLARDPEHFEHRHLRGLGRGANFGVGPPLGGDGDGSFQGLQGNFLLVGFQRRFDHLDLFVGGLNVEVVTPLQLVEERLCRPQFGFPLRHQQLKLFELLSRHRAFLQRLEPRQVGTGVLQMLFQVGHLVLLGLGVERFNLHDELAADLRLGQLARPALPDGRQLFAGLVPLADGQVVLRFTEWVAPQLRQQVPGVDEFRLVLADKDFQNPLPRRHPDVDHAAGRLQVRTAPGPSSQDREGLGPEDVHSPRRRRRSGHPRSERWPADVGQTWHFSATESWRGPSHPWGPDPRREVLTIRRPLAGFGRIPGQLSW